MWWHIISIESLRTILWRHFAEKPVMAVRNLGCFVRLNVNIHKGFHFYNLAVMTLVRNKLTWEYSRLSSLPPLETFCERSSLSKNVSSGVDWGKRSEAIFAGWNRLNPIYTRNFLALLALFQEYWSMTYRKIYMAFEGRDVITSKWPPSWIFNYIIVMPN